MWKNLTDNIKQKTGIGGNQPNLQGSQTSGGGGSGIQRRPTNATPVRPNNNLGQSGSNQGLGQSNNNNDINTEDWTEVLEEEEYIPAVELQDVMEDSPMLREKLHVLGQNVDVMAAKLRKIIKVSRTYQTSCKDMGQITEGFAHDLLNFNTGQASLQDPTLDEGLRRFGETFAECNEHYNMLATQLESVFSLPMETFVREDIREVKDEAKRYDKARGIYDSTCGKMGQLKKKDTSKIAEVEHELELSKQQFQLQGLEFVYKMNELQLKKKIEFLERVCAFMFGQLSFFHTGYQMFSEMEPYMRGLTVKLQQARTQFEEQKQGLQQQKKALIKFAAGPRQPRITEDSVETAGYLFKKRNNVLKEWERYYFVIKDGFLFFYKNGRDATPSKQESLLLFTVKPVDDPDRRFCFDIVSPTKVYSFQASSQPEMMEWIKVMQNTTCSLINSQRAVNKEGHVQVKESSVPKGPSPLAKLQELDDKNHYCVDCGAKDPNWALINWGALICLECSGVHRSLGVQVSRVRSLTLDALDQETVTLMEKIGNRNANAIFEYWLPPGVEKPNPKSSREAREKFIKLKWVQKTFVEAGTSTKDAQDLALWHASWEDDVLQIMKLVAQGGDVNYRAESEGKTPLHAAVIEGNLSCVEFLIQAGANVNPVDTWSWTPLHYAVLHGKVKCAILLVKRYADVAVKDRDGNTPLNIAVMNQQADCVTLLRLTQLSLQENPQHRDATSFATALKEFSASLDNNQPKDQNKDGNNSTNNSNSNSPLLLPSLPSIPSSTANPTSTQSQAQSSSSSSSVSASASTSALPKPPPTSPPVQQQPPTILVATRSQTIVDVPPVKGQPMGLPFAAQHTGEGPLSPSRSGPPTRAAPAPGHISTITTTTTTTTTMTTSASASVPVGGGGSQIRRVPPSIPPPSPQTHASHPPGNLPQPQPQPQLNRQES